MNPLERLFNYTKPTIRTLLKIPSKIEGLLNMTGNAVRGGASDMLGAMGQAGNLTMQGVGKVQNLLSGMDQKPANNASWGDKTLYAANKFMPEIGTAESVAKKIVPMMDNIDRNILEEFIDHVRLKKGENIDLEIQARKTAEAMGINPNKNNTRIAKDFEDILNVDRKPAIKGSMNNDLIQEARKYKTEEEFIKAQGTQIKRSDKIIGRGVVEEKDLIPFNDKNLDFRVSDIKKENGKIVLYRRQPVGQSLEPGNYLSPLKYSETESRKGYEVKKYLINEGDLSIDKNTNFPIYTPKKSNLTKSQLSQIWREANK